MTVLPKGNYVGLVMLLEWISIDLREKFCLRVCTKRLIGVPEFTYGYGFYKLLTKAGVDVKS